MAPVTVLLYCYRLPSISPAQLRTYVEETHVPYVKSLLKANYPQSHTRYYTNKDAGYVVGSPEDADADMIAIITYADEEHMKQSMAMRYSDGIRQLIQADEAKFMDVSKVKVIKMGGGDMGLSSNEEFQRAAGS